MACKTTKKKTTSTTTKKKFDPLPSEECDYGRLENTPKQLVKTRGIFSIPVLNMGKKDCGLRKFVTFYFDDESEYKKVVEYFDTKASPKKIPYMNTVKLMELMKGKEL
jgi:hypothetical protein